MLTAKDLPIDSVEEGLSAAIRYTLPDCLLVGNTMIPPQTEIRIGKSYRGGVYIVLPPGTKEYRSGAVIENRILPIQTAELLP